MKKCLTCGQDIPKNAMVCTYCNTQQPDVMSQSMEPVQSTSKFKISKPVVIIALVLVVVVCVLIFMNTGRRTMESALEEYYDVIADGTYKDFIDITCHDDIWESACKSDATFEIVYEVDYNWMVNEPIRNLKIVEDEKVSYEKFEEKLRDELAEGITCDNVSEVHELEVVFEQKSTDGWKERTDYLFAYKVGSKWYIIEKYW